jgi:hypothetical protein
MIASKVSMFHPVKGDFLINSDIFGVHLIVPIQFSVRFRLNLVKLQKTIGSCSTPTWRLQSKQYQPNIVLIVEINKTF